MKKLKSMCWGSSAVVLDTDGKVAKVDYGDGITREVFIGISEGRVEKGDLVVVHAGVIITKLTEESILEQISFIRETLGEEGELMAQMYKNILRLAEELKKR